MQPRGAEFVSGEGVRLALAPAGVGSRVIAALIDFAIMFGGLLALITITAGVAGGSDDAAVGAAVLVEVVAVLAGYPILCEWLSKGRTVGKVAMGLRVVRLDGGPIAFRHALVRGIAGLILEKPGLIGPLTSAAGVLTMTGTRREQRIGDLMAGTVVLNEHSAPQLAAPLPSWVPIPLQHWVLSLDLHRLDDRLAFSAWQFVSRAHAMSPSAQYTLGEEIRARVLAVTTPPPPPGTPTAAVLVALLAERRRRAWAGVPGPQFAAPPTTPPPPAAPPTTLPPTTPPPTAPPPTTWPSRPDEQPPFAPPL